MNGFELFREIRKMDEKVKVCFMTSFEVYFKAVKEEHPTLDMDCIIKKPVSMKNLLNKLKTELMKPNHFKIETSYYEDNNNLESLQRFLVLVSSRKIFTFMIQN
jgi:two-component SAPR family response regulator